MIPLLLTTLITLPLAQPSMGFAPQLPDPLVIPAGAIYPPGVGMYGPCWAVAEVGSTPAKTVEVYKCSYGDPVQCAATCEFIFGLKRYLWESVATCDDRVVFRRETDNATGDRFYALLHGTVTDQGPASPEDLLAVANGEWEPTLQWDYSTNPTTPLYVDEADISGPPVSTGDCATSKVTNTRHAKYTDYYCEADGDNCLYSAVFEMNNKSWLVEWNTVDCDGQYMYQKIEPNAPGSGVSYLFRVGTITEATPPTEEN